MEFTDPTDQHKVTTYQFARGVVMMLPRSGLDALKADLPAGTPVRVTELQADWIEAQVLDPVDVKMPELTGDRTVAYGQYTLRHPWPADSRLNGGKSGLVLRRGGGHYTTAFIEASVTDPQTFLRGEGDSIEEAEDNAWDQYQRVSVRDHDHKFETRGYTNGAGFCTHCGLFKSHAFSLQEIGSICGQCGADMYTTVGWKMFCKEHAPDSEARRQLRQEARAAGDPGEPLAELFDLLDDE